jgi:hypothetical protein
MANNTVLYGALALAGAEATGVTNFTGGSGDDSGDTGGSGGTQIEFPDSLGGGSGLGSFEFPDVSLPEFSPTITGGGGNGNQAAWINQMQSVIGRQEETIKTLTNTEQTDLFERFKNGNYPGLPNAPDIPTSRTGLMWSMFQNGGFPNVPGVPDVTGGNGNGDTDSSGSGEYHLHEQGFKDPVTAGFETVAETGEFVTNNPGTTAAALAAPFTGGSSYLLLGPGLDLAVDHGPAAYSFTAGVAEDTAAGTNDVWNWATPGNKNQGAIEETLSGTNDAWNWTTPNVNQVTGPVEGAWNWATPGNSKQGAIDEVVSGVKHEVKNNTGRDETAEQKAQSNQNVRSGRQEAMKQIEKLNRKNQKAARGLIK